MSSAGRTMQRTPSEEVSEMSGFTPLTQESLPPARHPLPPVKVIGMTLSEALVARRSSRNFETTTSIHRSELAAVLHACQGVTMAAPTRDALGHEPKKRRTTPSGGAIYPLEVFVVTTSRVEDL